MELQRTNLIQKIYQWGDSDDFPAKVNCYYFRSIRITMQSE
uniref:Uncharacterized protein n=1 Tax=Setaria italica TaxID=4555 RepID=K3ZGP5_SETIT